MKFSGNLASNLHEKKIPGDKVLYLGNLLSKVCAWKILRKSCRKLLGERKKGRTVPFHELLNPTLRNIKSQISLNKDGLVVGNRI